MEKAKDENVALENILESTHADDENDTYCEKPFDPENARFEDHDSPCINGEG